VSPETPRPIRTHERWTRNHGDPMAWSSKEIDTNRARKERRRILCQHERGTNQTHGGENGERTSVESMPSMQCEFLQPSKQSKNSVRGSTIANTLAERIWDSTAETVCTSIIHSFRSVRWNVRMLPQTRQKQLHLPSCQDGDR